MDFPDHQIKAFLDAAPDAMVIIDGQGKIALVNIETEAMFEYSRAELVGQPVEVLLPERLRERHGDHLLDYFTAPRGRQMGVGLELYAERKDGTEFPVEVSLSPVATDVGTYVASAIRDITDRKQNELKLVKARELAEHANREKSEFLAAASHDLRQPLQTLTLLSSVLGRIVPEASQAAIVVADQSAALRLMGELVNSLLDISKLEAGVVKPTITDFSVAQVLAGLRAEFAAVADAKGLKLIIEDCSDVVRSDSTLLSRVVQNLLGNAIRYTREGIVRLRCLVSLETVRIEVLDTGIGIPAEELNLVFDDFYQSPGRSGADGSGVGLGLSIARRIAELLGCPLEARSTVGQGSCFSLHVPRAPAKTRAADAIVRNMVTLRPDGVSILVVDDDAAVAQATAMLLESVGYRVIVAKSCAEALQKLTEHDGPPSLLICDYHLGAQENGVDVIRNIRARVGSDLPAILISGDTSSGIADSLSGIDHCHLLSKPASADDLLELADLARRPNSHSSDSHEVEPWSR